MRIKKVVGDLHSFLDEIGRVTKSSGFHYDVLDGKTITHHLNRWKVQGGGNLVVVEGKDGETLKLRLLGDEAFLSLNGEPVDALETPSGTFSGMEILNLIKDAVARHAIAQFFGISYADHLIPSTY
jgi:hypothetical protein